MRHTVDAKVPCAIEIFNEFRAGWTAGEIWEELEEDGFLVVLLRRDDAFASVQHVRKGCEFHGHRCLSIEITVGVVFVKAMDVLEEDDWVKMGTVGEETDRLRPARREIALMC